MNDTNSVNAEINDLVKLIAVLVKRDRSQSSLIVEMGEVGMQPMKIASLLGTSPNTVRVALSNYKKHKK